ncbi:SRPBCC domain-containing protein [Deinococcus sp. Arct2-2]|uniref:SRPBCC domain-containing protein n=1 Tax=Deinococcus sp. Arct2-2 TaxID=2568653 RepID=UPI0010A3DC07|nr:SRPBCC domain-containing protein [Deinococcus sp. Arct2-2]THF71773.1 SRPBCC domain-containing protein [Deinococcus sp. Arct2-2]
MTTETAHPELTLTRVFNAPRELVFQAWTDPDHLARWWGSPGVPLRVVSADIRPGGRFLYQQTTPDGNVMQALLIFRELEPPSRIVFVSAFADAEGQIARAPFSEHWPLQIMTTLTLTEENGQTHLTLQGAPLDATPEEQAMFDGFRANMEQGFAGSFAQLEAHLAAVAAG